MSRKPSKIVQGWSRGTLAWESALSVGGIVVAAPELHRDAALAPHAFLRGGEGPAPHQPLHVRPAVSDRITRIICKGTLLIGPLHTELGVFTCAAWRSRAHRQAYDITCDTLQLEACCWDPSMSVLRC